MLNEKLYPPQLAGTLPAFCKTYNPDTGVCTGAELTIPFTMNQAVSESQLDGFVLKMKTVQTGTYLFAPLYSMTFNLAKNTVTFLLTEAEAEKINEGQYYKIQLAYFAFEQFEAVDDAGNLIISKDPFTKISGHFSTVGVIKCVSKPTVTIKGFSNDSINLFQNEIYGLYSLENAVDKTEKVYSYNFKFYDEQNEVAWDSGELIHNCATDAEYGLSHDILILNNFIENNKVYSLVYTVTTRNGYVASSPLYKITSDNLLPPTKEMSIIATGNYEDGYVHIGFQGILEEKVFNAGMPNETKRMVEQPYFGEFLLSRSSEESNFTEWLELKRFRLENSAPSHVSFNDFSIEQGVKYIYSVQQYNMWGLYSSRILSEYVSVDFEDMYLYDGQRSLKIKFNPKISSFKTNVLEQKVDTIGNKYPFIFRNGNVNYKEFPISGLISYQMDDAMLFYDREIHNFMRTTSNTTDTAITEEEIRDILYYNPNQLSEYNIHTERDFKLEVLDWLNNGKPKLFRSATEGNYIVRLMNVNLQPIDTLGRMLHSFSCNAYEIAEFNYKNLMSFNFVEASEVSDYVSLWRSYNLNDYEFGKDIEIIFDKEVSSFTVQDMLPGQNIYLYYLNAPAGEFEIITIGVTGSYRFENSSRSVYKIVIPNIAEKISGVIECQYEGLRYSEFDAIKNISLKTILSNQYVGVNPALLRLEQGIHRSDSPNLMNGFMPHLMPLDIRILINDNDDYNKENLANWWFDQFNNREFMAGDIVQQINSSIFDFKKSKIKILNMEQVHLRTRKVCSVYTAPYEYIDYNFWDKLPNIIKYGDAKDNNFYKQYYPVGFLTEEEFKSGDFYLADDLQEVLVSEEIREFIMGLVPGAKPAEIYDSETIYYRNMYSEADYNSEFWPINYKFYFISLLQEPYPFDELMGRLRDDYDINDPYPMFLLLEYHKDIDEWLPRVNENEVAVLSEKILNGPGCYYDPYWNELLLEYEYDTKFIINEPLYIYEPINKLTTISLKDYYKDGNISIEFENYTNYINIENISKFSTVRVIYENEDELNYADAKYMQANELGNLRIDMNTENNKQLISKIIIYNQEEDTSGLLTYNYCNLSNIINFNDLFILDEENNYIPIIQKYFIEKDVYDPEMYELINSHSNLLYLRQFNGIDLAEKGEDHYYNLGEVEHFKIGTGLIAEATFQLQILDYFTEEHDLETAGAKQHYIKRAEFLRNIYRAYEILADSHDKYQKYLSLSRFYNTLINGGENLIANKANVNDHSSSDNSQINYHDRVVLDKILNFDNTINEYEIYNNLTIPEADKKLVDQNVKAVKANPSFRDSLKLEEDELQALLYLIENKDVESLNSKLTQATEIRNAALDEIAVINNQIADERNNFSTAATSFETALSNYNDNTIIFKASLWIAELIRRVSKVASIEDINERLITKKIAMHYKKLLTENETTVNNASVQKTQYANQYMGSAAQIKNSLNNIFTYQQIIKDKNEDEILDEYLYGQINNELKLILIAIKQLNHLKQNLNLLVNGESYEGEDYLTVLDANTATAIPFEFAIDSWTYNTDKKVYENIYTSKDLIELSDKSEVNILEIHGSIYNIEDFTITCSDGSFIISTPLEIIQPVEFKAEYLLNEEIESQYKFETIIQNINNYFYLFKDEKIQFFKTALDLFTKAYTHYQRVGNNLNQENVFNSITLIDELEYVYSGYALLTNSATDYFIDKELKTSEFYINQTYLTTSNYSTMLDWRENTLLPLLNEFEEPLNRIIIPLITLGEDNISDSIYNNQFFDGYENESTEDRERRYTQNLTVLVGQLDHYIDKIDSNKSYGDTNVRADAFEVANTYLQHAIGFGYSGDNCLINSIENFNTMINSYYIDLYLNVDKNKIKTALLEDDFNFIYKYNHDGDGVETLISFGPNWKENFEKECPSLKELLLPRVNGKQIDEDDFNNITINRNENNKPATLKTEVEQLNTLTFNYDEKNDNPSPSYEEMDAALVAFLLNFNIVNSYSEERVKYSILSLNDLANFKDEDKNLAQTGIFEWYIKEVLEVQKEYFETLYDQSQYIVLYYEDLLNNYREKQQSYSEKFDEYRKIFISYLPTEVYTYYMSAAEDKEKTLNKLIQDVKDAWNKFVLILDKAYTKEYNGGMYR